MITEILVFLLTALIVAIIYGHHRAVNKFRKDGLNVHPGVPIFGNTLKSTFKRRHIFYDLDDVYRAFPDDKYIGFMDAVGSIIIRDPELIKQITIKDFDHFVDRGGFSNDTANPLLSSSLLFMKGDKWRDMRITLSPAFTGSKMKKMIPFMSTAAANIVQYLEKEANGNISEDIDVDDLIRRYTNDVIASIAFGLEVNSVADKNNEFYKTGQILSKFTMSQMIKFLIISVFPKFAEKLNLKVFPDRVDVFFRNIVKDTMDYREKNNIERPDMIHLLMEAAKGTLSSEKDKDENNIALATTEESDLKSDKPVRQWTPDELTAQAFLFFSAGFETSASALSMAVHELTINPDVQQKLYEEIKQVKDEKKDVTFDTIQNMKYLDMVVNEALRKWAPALVLNRECTKTYYLPPVRPGAKPYKIEKGKVIFNLVNSIHMDEKYFPNPEKFDPERFSEENKNNIEPFTFMPFGAGPRSCIGSRFALLELKVFLYHLLITFELVKCSKTMDPLRLTASDFTLRSMGGTWVKLRKRM